jgi:hypothetical protein
VAGAKYKVKALVLSHRTVETEVGGHPSSMASGMKAHSRSADQNIFEVSFLEIIAVDLLIRPALVARDIQQ